MSLNNIISCCVLTDWVEQNSLFGTRLRNYTCQKWQDWDEMNGLFYKTSKRQKCLICVVCDKLEVKLNPTIRARLVQNFDEHFNTEILLRNLQNKHFTKIILDKEFWPSSKHMSELFCNKKFGCGADLPPPLFLDNIKYFVSFFLLVWQWHVNFGYGCDFGLAEEGQT